MAFSDHFVGVPQSRWAGYAILAAVLVVATMVIIGKKEVPVGQRVLVVLIMLLFALPIIGLTLFQLNCLVVGTSKAPFCGWYAWVISVLTILYCALLIIVAITAKSYEAKAEQFANMSVSYEDANKMAKKLLGGEEGFEDAPAAGSTPPASGSTPPASGANSAASGANPPVATASSSTTRANKSASADRRREIRRLKHELEQAESNLANKTAALAAAEKAATTANAAVQAAKDAVTKAKARVDALKLRLAKLTGASKEAFENDDMEEGFENDDEPEEFCNYGGNAASVSDSPNMYML